MNHFHARLGLLAACLALWACSSSDDSGQQPSNQTLEGAGNGGTAGAPGGGGEGGTPSSGASPSGGQAGQPSGSAGVPSAGAPSAGAGGTAGGTTAGSGGAPSGQCKSITEFAAGGAISIPPTVPEQGHDCGQEGLEICTQPSFDGSVPQTLSRCEGGQWTTVESPSMCHVVVDPPVGACNAELYYEGKFCSQTVEGAGQVSRCEGGVWVASSEGSAGCSPMFQQCAKGGTATQGPVAAEGNCCQEHIYCANYGLYCDGTQWRKY